MSELLKTHDTIHLWPGRVAPGSEKLGPLPVVLERSTDLFWPDRILSNIAQPSLTAFFPKKPRTGAAVVIAPGGAYSRIVLDKEAAEMAVWLNSLGIVAFVLQYRLPSEDHLDSAKAPIADAQRALRIVRHNARRWGIDQGKIGFLGCSAGGHLGVMLSAQFDFQWYSIVDEIDRDSARPDFLMLLYPVVSMDDDFCHKESRMNLLGSDPTSEEINRYSPQRHIRANFPSTLVVVSSDDDCVPHENSLLLNEALGECGGDCELHVFEEGGHGFGIRDAQQYPVAAWTSLAESWLRTRLILPSEN